MADRIDVADMMNALDYLSYDVRWVRATALHFNE